MVAPVVPFWIKPCPGIPGTGHYLDPRTRKRFTDAACTIPYVSPTTRKDPSQAASDAR